MAADRAEEAIGGYVVLADWSARDLQRDESAVRLGPAKGKDFATTFGPWLVTPDELADVRSGKAYELACTAEVNGQVISRGNLGKIHHSFGAMIERAGYPGIAADLDLDKIAAILPMLKKKAREMQAEGQALTGHPGLPAEPTPNLVLS